MSKKVTKLVQKEETVTVCDTCNKEVGWNNTVELDISWSKNCPRDNCYDDWGEFNYCSYDCFVKGASRITEEIQPDEDFYAQSFTIRASGVGEDNADTFPELLRHLAGVTDLLATDNKPVDGSANAPKAAPSKE
jgi:hypothetical protein